MWSKTQTEPYYTRIVLPIAECRHADIPRADEPTPQLNLVLQSPTTPGQFDMWHNADVPMSGVPPHHLVIKPSGTEHYYTRWV